MNELKRLSKANKKYRQQLAERAGYTDVSKYREYLVGQENSVLLKEIADKAVVIKNELINRKNYNKSLTFDQLKEVLGQEIKVIVKAVSLTEMVKQLRNNISRTITISFYKNLVKEDFIRNLLSLIERSPPVSLKRVLEFNYDNLLMKGVLRTMNIRHINNYNDLGYLLVQDQDEKEQKNQIKSVNLMNLQSLTVDNVKYVIK